jgi:hypothetical protein
MHMERDRFEEGLDRVIAAHGRKVRSGIDAVACGTRGDWLRSHQAEAAYHEARDAFIDEVMADGVDAEVAEERPA